MSRYYDDLEKRNRKQSRHNRIVLAYMKLPESDRTRAVRSMIESGVVLINERLELVPAPRRKKKRE